MTLRFRKLSKNPIESAFDFVTLARTSIQKHRNSGAEISPEDAERLEEIGHAAQALRLLVIEWQSMGRQ